MSPDSLCLQQIVTDNTIAVVDEVNAAAEAMDLVDATSAAAQLAVLTATELGSRELDIIAQRTQELRKFKAGLKARRADAAVPEDFPVENEEDALRVLTYQLTQRTILDAKRAVPHASLLSLRVEPLGKLDRAEFTRYGHATKLQQSVASDLSVAVNELATVLSEEPEPLVVRFRVPPYVSMRRIDRLLTSISREGYQPLLPEYAIVSCEFKRGVAGEWQGSAPGWHYELPTPPDEWCPKVPPDGAAHAAAKPHTGDLGDLDETGATDSDILNWQRGKRAARLKRDPSAHSLGSSRSRDVRRRASLDEIAGAVAEFAQFGEVDEIESLSATEVIDRVRNRAELYRSAREKVWILLQPHAHALHATLRPADCGQGTGRA
jgi:hypothetical protein